MNTPDLKRMTAEEYAKWSERQQTGRYEGVVDLDPPGIVVALDEIFE